MSTPEQRAIWRDKGKRRYWAMSPEERKAYNRKRSQKYYKPGTPKRISVPKAAKREFVLRLKFERGGCEDCGLPVDEWNHPVMEWDHIDPMTKEFELSRAQNMKNMPFERIRAESEKCRLLCANCHRLRTYWDRHHVIGDCRGKHYATASDELTLFGDELL